MADTKPTEVEETKEQLQAQADRLKELGRPVPKELEDAIKSARSAPAEKAEKA